MRELVTEQREMQELGGTGHRNEKQFKGWPNLQTQGGGNDGELRPGSQNTREGGETLIQCHQ